MKASARFVDYQITGITTEDTEYLAASMKTLDSSTESWRSLNTNAHAITIDLGAAVEDPTVVVYRANFGTTIRFKGNDSDSWGAPAFTSADFALEQDPDDTLRKRGVLLTGFNYRYLRVEIPSQTPDPDPVTGGAVEYFEIGALAVIREGEMEDFGVFAGGFEAPEMRQLIAEAVNRFETNRKDVIPLAPHPVLEIQLSGTMKNSVENRQKVNRVLGDPLRAIAYLDRSREGNSWQVYLAQRTSAGLTTSEPVAGNLGVRVYSGTWETIL